MTGIANTGMAPTPQPQKSAHRMLERQADGSLKSVLVDDNTGQPVTNPAGYNVTDGFFSDLSSLGLNPTVGATPQTGANMPQSTAQKVINPDTGGNGQDHSSSDRAGQRAQARDSSNNYGYIDKPGAVSLAGMLPGPIGLAGKAVNAGINANNLAATNAARTELGLPDTTGMAAAKSVISNNQGQVANIGIGDQNYSVGLAAMSPTGMTNMTPDEARMHALLNNQQVQELSPAQAAAQKASFDAANNPNAGPFTGMFAGVLNGAKNFVDNLFSSPVNNSFPSAPPSPMDNNNHYGGGYQGTTSGSDGNNSGTTTGNNANTNGQGTASKGSIGRSEGDGNFGGSSGGGMGLSPGAAGAIGAGGGGLY